MYVVNSIWAVLLVALVTFVTSNEYDVIIVGAGFAGLAAGKYFHENGVNFIILEANDYLGGRVKKSSFGNETIELGAQWIHVLEHNHIIKQKADQYKMKFYLDEINLSKDFVFREKEKGTVVPISKIQYQYQKLEEAMEVMDKITKKRVADGKGALDVLTGLRWGGFVADTHLKTALEYLMFEYQNGAESGLVNSLSYGSLNEPEEPEKIITDKRGYAYPVLHESQPFLNRTKTNCRVTDILMHSKKRFTVNCSDGSTYQSKFVMVTVSTGVLQANTIKFTPPLPSWKTQAVSMFPMCHYCKIFLKFSNVFWDQDKAYIMIMPIHRKGYFVHWQNLDR